MYGYRYPGAFEQNAPPTSQNAPAVTTRASTSSLRVRQRPSYTSDHVPLVHADNNYDAFLLEPHHSSSRMSSAETMAARYRRDSLGHDPDEPPMPKKSFEATEHDNNVGWKTKAPHSRTPSGEAIGQKYRRDSFGHNPNEPPIPPRQPEALDRESLAVGRSRAPSGFWIRDTLGRPVLEILPREDGYETVHWPLPDGPRGDKEFGNRATPERPGDTPEDESSDEEKAHKGPPKPVDFWHKGLNATRKQVLKEWGIMTGILCVFILTILSLFWGVLFNVEQNMNSLIVFVVDFETQSDALVGPLVTDLTESIIRENTMPHLGFITIPPSTYNYDHLAVREAIYQHEAWAAIVINSNATTLLRQAVETGNSSYDPTGAIQLIYVEARDQDSYFNYIYPNMQLLEQQIMQEFGSKWSSEIMSNTSISRENLEKVPQAVNPGVGFSIFSLRPFGPAQAVPAVSIGLIYLIIISFFSFGFFMPIHMKFAKPEGHPPLKFNHIIAWRYVATITAYLILSLFYSTVSAAFQIPFGDGTGSHYVSETNANAFGNGTFPVYWMINWIGMIALGMACENVAMVIGQPWTALWLIFWVITNVSTAFYAIELSPGFYRWGYAWPLHNVVEASRTVLFDLHSRLGLNFGVLFAWVAVNTALFPFACYFMRWKQMRDMKKQQQQQKNP